MKYKDYIKKLPFELQDKILDLVFNDVKNYIKNNFNTSLKSELVYINEHNLIYQFSVSKFNLNYNLYNNLHSISHIFSKNDEKKIYVSYSDIYYFINLEECSNLKFINQLIPFEFTNKNSIIFNEVVDCYINAFDLVFKEAGYPLLDLSNALDLLEIKVVKKNDKAFIKATIEVDLCSSEKYLRVSSI